MRRGVSKMLCVSPTGSGKTVTFAFLPQAIELAPGEKLMVLVHRNELVYQSAEKLQRYNPNLRVGIERASEKASPMDDIVVASVQSIGKAKRLDDGSFEFSERLRKFNPDDFKALVIDEAHHAIGESYANVTRYFGICKPETKYDNSNKILIGFTATPNRSDNVGLELIFDQIVFSREIREMIEAGWLTDIKAYRIDTLVDISQVAISRGDWVVSDLERTVNTPERNDLIVRKYIELGEGMSAFAFTVDIQHAVDLAAAFNKEGISAYMVSGNTPEDDRKKILQMFRDGQVKVLASAGVLSEGVDVPSVGCGLMCRPWKKALPYIQQVGRVLRPFPAPEELESYRQKNTIPKWIKPHAIILDFCDLSGRHQLNTVPTLFGLRPDFNLKGKKATETVKKIEETLQQKCLPIPASQFRSLEELQSIEERVDLLKMATIPDEVKKVSNLAWVTGPTGGYQICLPDYAILRISQDTLGQWQCYRSVKGVRSLLFSDRELGSVMKKAEGMIPREAMITLQSDAKWRLEKASEAQAKLLWKLKPSMRNGFPSMDSFAGWVMENYSKGDASTLISSLLGSSRR